MPGREHPSFDLITRAARLRARGRTQAEVAEALDVARRTVQRWEADAETWHLAEIEAGVATDVALEESDTTGDTRAGSGAGTGPSPRREGVEVARMENGNRGRYREGTSRGGYTSESVPSARTSLVRRAQSVPPARRGGVPTSAIREKLRLSTSQRVTIIEGIADDPKASNNERLKALKLLLEYSIGRPRELDADSIRNKLVRTIEVLRDELPEELAAPILSRLKGIWS